MDDDQGSLYPLLPPELEHKIFTLSLPLWLDANLNATSLFLVAKRVFEWLTPLYYKVVMIPDFDEARNVWPPFLVEGNLEKYGHLVRHFHISMQSFGDILSKCPNITEMAFWSDLTDEDVEAIIKLPITHLSIDLATFFRDDVNVHRFCSTVTQLDISGSCPGDLQKMLPYFKVLTRLAFFGERYVPTSLEHGKTLEVIIVMSSGDHSFLQEKKQKPESGDVRVVYVSIGCSYEDDWKEGAYGRMDMWAFAEELIQSRRLLAAAPP